MKTRIACLAAASVALALTTACSSTRSWVPDISMPDFAGWFTSENQVLVSEVFNDSQCNAPDERTRVQLLSGPAAVATWQAGRGVSLLGSTELPDNRYVAVDLGLRRSGGYGMAVSRQAALRDGVLVLKATTFEPKEAEASTSAITSPCSLVKLPDIQFESMRLIDQSGKVRASSLTTDIRS